MPQMTNVPPINTDACSNVTAASCPAGTSAPPSEYAAGRRRLVNAAEGSAYAPRVGSHVRGRSENDAPVALVRVRGLCTVGERVPDRPTDRVALASQPSQRTGPGSGPVPAT